MEVFFFISFCLSFSLLESLDSTNDGLESIIQILCSDNMRQDHRKVITRAKLFSVDTA